ncbi:MAG: hypothetical protein A2Y88_06760 [Chloroflexi bacterium RBG_13_48_10]|nr:MAG: hypothetical protein A2Y88_06760 [Chloroflexi bacterium RBG_13_48_10]
MFNKLHITPLFFGIILLGFYVVVWARQPSPVVAQCGIDPMPESSCITCHVQEAPVFEDGVWHGVHGRKDCCSNCHGGNCKAMDENLAHQSLILNPLSDIYTNCHSCHPDDYMARAAVFAAELGITPISIQTPTPFPVGKVAASPLVILPSPAAGISSGFPIPIVLGGLAFLILFLLGLITLIMHLRA